MDEEIAELRRLRRQQRRAKRAARRKSHIFEADAPLSDEPRLSHERNAWRANDASLAEEAEWNALEAAGWGPDPIGGNRRDPNSREDWGWTPHGTFTQSDLRRTRKFGGDGERQDAWNEDMEPQAKDDSGSGSRKFRKRTMASKIDSLRDSWEAYREREVNPKDEGEESDVAAYEPDIIILSPQELDRVLPVIPFSMQADFFSGGPTQAVQRWGASLALTVILNKLALLAATSLTWPLWWPWAQAAVKNYGMRKQAGYAGLWRTQVLEVESRGRPKVRFGAAMSDDDAYENIGEDFQSEAYADESSEGFQNPSQIKSSKFGSTAYSRFSTIRTTRIVLGDPDGALTELILPHDARFDLIQIGQAAELIVLSQSPTFESFRAVKDVYLPDSGVWLSEYPFLDRSEFLKLSLEIEREGNVIPGNPSKETEPLTSVDGDETLSNGFDDPESWDLNDNNYFDDGYKRNPIQYEDIDDDY